MEENESSLFLKETYQLLGSNNKEVPKTSCFPCSHRRIYQDFVKYP